MLHHGPLSSTLYPPPSILHPLSSTLYPPPSILHPLSSLWQANDLAAVLRSRFIGKDFVVTQFIAGHAVVIASERIVDLQIGRIAQIAEQRDDGDVNHVVAEAASIRPSAGHEEIARRQS